MSKQHAEAVKFVKKYFSIKELVSKTAFESFPEETLWGLFDTKLLLGLYWVRAKTCKPIIINNWHLKGVYSESGFRLPSSMVGAVLSSHRLGKGLDLKAGDMNELRNACIECPHFTEIEDETFTPTWCHVSTREHFKDGLRIVKP